MTVTYNLINETYLDGRDDNYIKWILKIIKINNEDEAKLAINRFDKEQKKIKLDSDFSYDFSLEVERLNAMKKEHPNNLAVRKLMILLILDQMMLTQKTDLMERLDLETQDITLIEEFVNYTSDYIDMKKEKSKNY